MGREPGLARRFFDRFEPVHAVTYFAPEARAAVNGLGYRGFWIGYFAPVRVAKALPAAWRAALWHATTLLREQRGDAPAAVLTAAGVSGGNPTCHARRRAG